MHICFCSWEWGSSASSYAGAILDLAWCVFFFPVTLLQISGTNIWVRIWWVSSIMDHPPNCRLTAESTHVSSALTIPVIASLVLLLVAVILCRRALSRPQRMGSLAVLRNCPTSMADRNWQVCQVVCINGTNSLILSESMPLALWLCSFSH